MKYNKLLYIQQSKMDMEMDLESEEQPQQQTKLSMYLHNLLAAPKTPPTNFPPALQSLYKSLQNTPSPYLPANLTPSPSPSSPSLQTFFQNYKYPQSTTKTKYKKLVCAKVLKKDDVIVECYQCGVDGNCVVCLDCFRNGRHQGHRYFVRKAVGGCCDCGDREAWKEAGFCVNHTGMTEQLPIPQSQLHQTQQKLHQLFFLHFHLILTKHPKSPSYTSSLISYLLSQNINSPYNNQLTSHAMNTKLPENLRLNQVLDGGTVLENLVKFGIMGAGGGNGGGGGGYGGDLLELFLGMFGCYGFKMGLLGVYMREFGEIVDGSQASFRFAGSLACQILTSHQLIQTYSKTSNIGLAQSHKYSPQLTQSTINNFRRYYLRMNYDLNYILKLQGTAPLAYWKMHINSCEGLYSIFKYYEEIWQYGEKCLGEMGEEGEGEGEGGGEEVAVLVGLVGLAGVQEEVVGNFGALMGVIKGDQVLMGKVIRFLVDKCDKFSSNTHEQATIIFKPYQRCLALSIFTQLSCQLPQFPNSPKIQNILSQISPKKPYLPILKNILHKLRRTYLLYPKTIAEPGFGQSVYHYLYFYKIKYHFLFQVDVVAIKMLLLMVGKGKKQGKGEEEEMGEEQGGIGGSFLEGLRGLKAEDKSSKVMFNSTLTFIRYLYTFNICQASVTAQIDPKSSQYNPNTSDILFRYFTQHKGSIPVQKMNQFITKLFSQNVKYIQEWLKQNCTINKEKKQFMLNKYVGDMEDQKEGLGKGMEKEKGEEKGMNFCDLWESCLMESYAFADPWKTRQAITGENQEVFGIIWGKQAVEELVDVFERIYGDGRSEGVQTALSNIMHIYLMKLEKQCDVPSLEKRVLLPNLSRIPPQILSKFPQLKPQNPPQLQPELQPKSQSPQKSPNNLQSLKQKKLQQMKQKQKKFLNSQAQTLQQQPTLQNIPPNSNRRTMEEEVRDKGEGMEMEKKEKEKVEVEEKEEEVCCICRNQSGNNLVCLVRLEMRNSQGVLGVGVGVGCLSFYSCYHTFHWECLKKSNFRIMFKNLISCPLCKTLSTIPLPLSTSLTSYHHLSLSFLQQIQIAASQQSTPETKQQFLIKSFYHYVLLCYVDIRNATNKRGQLYRLILGQLLALVADQDGDGDDDDDDDDDDDWKEKREKERRVKGKGKRDNWGKFQEAILGELFQRMMLEKKNKQQKQQAFKKQNEICEQKSKKIIKKQGPITRARKQSVKKQTPKLKSPQKIISKPAKVQNKKQKQEKKQQKIEEQFHSSNLFLTIKMFLIFLRAKAKGQKLQQSQIEQLKSQSKDKNFITHSQHCFKLLFELQLQPQTPITNSNPLTPLPKLLKPLPQNYSQHIPKQQCSNCHQTMPNMMQCLLCDWVGCQVCEQGKNYIHCEKRHYGGIGVFMEVGTAIAMYQSSFGVAVVGRLYEDQWGKGVERCNRWEEFQLDRRKVKEIQDTIIYDRTINNYSAR